MKIDCDVIRDLLPLYHDQVCSEKTAEMVEDHLVHCAGCRKYLRDLDEDLNLGDPVKKAKPLRDVGRRIRRMKFLAFGLGLLAAAVIMFLCWTAAAKYSEFVHYLLYLARRSLKLLIPILAVSAAVAVGLQRQYRKKGKVFPWGKAISWMLLLGWAGVYLYATVFQNSYGARFWNLQPFLVVREALNQFTPQLILNVFINIGVFVPFGILMPILFKRQKKWYWALLTGVLTGAAFELLQLVTCQGICDIDDVIMDTLGTMLGWSGTMLVLSIQKGEKVSSFRFLTVPAAALLTVGIIFGGYYLKPYGNFPDGPARRPNLSQVTFEEPEILDKSEGMSAPVFKVGRITREESEQFAMDFSARQGFQFNDVMYYDTMIIYADRQGEGGFLSVYYQDGSWDYNLGNSAELFFTDPMQELDRLKEYLQQLGLTIPDTAEFQLEDADSPVPVIRIRVNQYHDGENLHHGEIVCQFFQMEDRYRLMDVNNRVFTLETVGHEKIMSEAEAYEHLTRGKSFKGIHFDRKTMDIQVERPVLDWKTDTKGFYQPVYRFTLTDLVSGRVFTDYVAALH